MAVVTKNRYFRGGTLKFTAQKLSTHFKYLEHRPRQQQELEGREAETREDRYLFTAESDHVLRRQAVDDIMSHTHQRVNYHHLVLSPGEEDQVSDLRQWTRAVMADLEQWKQQRLVWYAVQHRNTAHPHVHVVIAGAAEQYGTDRQYPVVLRDNPDFDFVKARGREHSDYAFYQTIQQATQALEGEDELMGLPSAEKEQPVLR